MANTYLQFSEAIQLKNQTQVKWAKARLLELETLNEASGQSGWFDWSIDEGRVLWMHDNDDYGNVDAVSEFVQEYLAKFDPDGCFALSWAETCSRPRAGEFGGGAVFVTAKKVEWINTFDWLGKQVNKHKPTKKKRRK